MAYALKYILSFFSERNNDYRIEILQDGYSGQAVTKCLGVPPILSIEDGDGRIKGSSLTFSVQADTEGELAGLYTTNNKKFRADLYRNGQLYWQGYLLPELYSENYIDPPFDVSVTASDQLATLKNMQYSGEDKQSSLYSIIEKLLAQTKLSMPIVEHMQLKAANTATMLKDSYINEAAYNGYTCYEALDAILLSCNCHIMQLGCRWLVTSDTCISGEYARIGQMHIEPIYPDGSLTMTSVPAYKGVTLIYNHIMRNSMLQNADMTSRDNWSYVADPKDDGRFPGEITADDGKRYRCYFWQLSQKNLKKDSSLQLWQDIALKADPGYSYGLNFKYLLSQDAYMMLLAVTHTSSGGTTRRLTSSGWTTSFDNSNINSYIQVTGEKKAAPYIWDIADQNNYEEATVYFSLPEQDGTLRIGFINPTENYADPGILPTAAYVTKVYLTVTGITGQQAVSEVEPNATTAQKEIELGYGDAVASANADKLTLNTLNDSTGKAHAIWLLDGVEYPSYYMAMLQDFSRLIGQKRMQLSGVLQGVNLLYNRYLETFSGKVMRLLSGQYNLLDDTLNVALEEVITSNVDYEVVIYATESAEKNETSTAPGVSIGGSVAQRIIQLDEASDTDIQDAYLPVDKNEWTAAKKISAAKLGLNKEELERYLAENQYLNTEKGDERYATKDLVDTLEERAQTAENNASDALDIAKNAQTTASNVSSRLTTLTNTVGNKASQASVNALSEDVADITNSVASLSVTVGNLSNTVANKADKSTVTSLTNTVNDLSSDVLDAMEAAEDASKAASNVSGQLTTLSNTVTNKADKSTVTSLTNTVSNLSTSVTNLGNEISDIADVADNAQRTANNLNSSVSTNSKNIDTLFNNFRIVNENVRELSDEVSALADEINALVQRIVKLESMWYIDTTNNAVRTSYNIIGDKQGIFGE